MFPTLPTGLCHGTSLHVPARYEHYTGSRMVSRVVQRGKTDLRERATPPKAKAAQGRPAWATTQDNPCRGAPTVKPLSRPRPPTLVPVLVPVPCPHAHAHTHPPIRFPSSTVPKLPAPTAWFLRTVCSDEVGCGGVCGCVWCVQCVPVCEQLHSRTTKAADTHHSLSGSSSRWDKLLHYGTEQQLTLSSQDLHTPACRSHAHHPGPDPKYYFFSSVPRTPIPPGFSLLSCLDVICFFIPSPFRSGPCLIKILQGSQKDQASRFTRNRVSRRFRSPSAPPSP